MCRIFSFEKKNCTMIESILAKAMNIRDTHYTHMYELARTRNMYGLLFYHTICQMI